MKGFLEMLRNVRSIRGMAKGPLLLLVALILFILKITGLFDAVIWFLIVVFVIAGIFLVWMKQ